MVVYALEHPRARELSHALLARCVRLYWGISPLPELERGEHGKPFFPALPRCCFNLSHSGDLAVCALDSAPVGVDIQRTRPARESLLREVCSPEEREWLRRRGDGPEDFALLWSMKEARCKYTGQGLRRPISAIRVPLPGAGEEALELDGLRFYLGSGPGWRLCLCGTGMWDGNVIWLPETEIIKEESAT